MAEAIRQFQGAHRFLSNFTAALVYLDGLSYPTVEHAYQAAKTVNPAQRKFIRDARSAAIAKGRGRRVTLRADWDTIKLDVMRDLVRQKFAIPIYRDQLLGTDDAELIEGNDWGDTFWGATLVGPHAYNGANHLGRLIMEIREELRRV